MSKSANCIFCKIVQGIIPCHKIYETELSLVFLDISPLSWGHALVIPKYHGQFLHQIPDDHLADLLPVTKKVALALGTEQYNILQNNGRLAHQAVDHVHVHIIPKTPQDGLGIEWKSLPDHDLDFPRLAKDLSDKLLEQQIV